MSTSNEQIVRRGIHGLVKTRGEFVDWGDEALQALDRLVAERDRLRDALQAIGDRGDMEPFDEHGAPVLIAIAREALLLEQREGT